MRYLREVCGVIVLACVFTLSTQAGEISCPGLTEPPPPPPPPMEAATAGEIECGVLEAALSIIQSVLALP
jgi:hypothetical protein